MRDYIFDTTALSNFASTGRVDLLNTRYRGVAFTTMEVTDELRRGVKAGYSYLEHVLQQIEPVAPPLSGTLGILIALVHHNAFSLKEANAMLTAMIQRRYRSPVDRLDEFI